MASTPNNANAHCPGVESQDAGKDAACAGCPNQQICSTRDASLPDPGIELVRARLATVKNKILILSGKGGVGKSTMTCLIARGLATDVNQNVAVCDLDICGPSIPRMLGAIGEQIHQSGSGWSPVYVDENLCVASIGFLLGSADDAVIWRGPKKNAMVRQLLADVDWGVIQHLLIDMPPGTSDEHLSAASYLAQANLTGAILVTTPQEVALLDVRKEIGFCRKVNIPILGVVENMASFICPHCSSESILLRSSNGGAQAMCEELGVRFLGKVPLEPNVARCCDQGINLFEQFPESSTVLAVQSIISRILSIIEAGAQQTAL